MKKKPDTTADAVNAKKKTLKGVVVSDKMTKTVVVAVTRFVKHPKYHKYFKVTKKYKAHDDDNSAKTGDTVEIASVRPMSKDKRFVVVK
ncbi:MAG TPA: 30S ribosomal protein S17 [Candidatus Paceibacterota bacterium]|jgi:small subunit ribosomal protein S17|nr:30S ribosomal protein S17 [Candidatus Paceibacterota bacterium]